GHLHPGDGGPRARRGHGRSGDGGAAPGEDDGLQPKQFGPHAGRDLLRERAGHAVPRRRPTLSAEYNPDAPGRLTVEALSLEATTMWEPSARYPDPAVRELDPAFNPYRLMLAS